MATGTIRQDISGLTGTEKLKSQSGSTSFRKQISDAELKKQLERQNKFYIDYAKKRHKSLADLDKKELEDAERRFKQKETAKLNKSLKDWEEYYNNIAKVSDKTSTKIAAKSLEIATKAYSAMESSINSYIGTYSNYLSGLETRLQGYTRTAEDMTGQIKSGVGFSPYVKQTAVLDNLAKLVDKGIAYNVEQRAFLASVSDRIATTFDAFDASLLRIIRIQQSDTTAARLGLEASLTKYFNAMFGDTSYLSDTYSGVAQILLESSSQLNGQQSIAYEYAIQKWLGSLGSVGVSSSTLQSLAQGLSYLGTGDISALTSNESLQRLLVTAAGSRYSDILTGGLSPENANQILRNIVDIAQQIGGIESNVVRQQYASLYGFTLSDITSIMNLTSQDLVDISQNMLTYQQAMEETRAGLATLGERTPIKTMVDNVLSNVMTSMGESIGSNAATYLTWSIADMLDQYVGGINIPTIFAMGTGIDLNTTVAGLMKVGLMGYSILDNLGTAFASLTKGGALDLDSWGASDFTTRGTGTTSLKTTGMVRGISQTAFIGNVGASDIYEGSIANVKESESYTSAQEEGNNTMNIIKDDIAEINRTVTDIYSLLQMGIRVATEFGGYSL